MTVTLCTACGFNIIGQAPSACPFCGAAADKFLPAEMADRTFKVDRIRVTDHVTRLETRPRLGLEHAAYEIKNGGNITWIDCPSVYDRSLRPPHRILFTHKDFLGASPLYRRHAAATLWLHKADAAHPVVANHPIDERPAGDFSVDGINGWHLPGHSPGYMVYSAEDVLFPGDLLFFRSANMRVNPFGKAGQEMTAAHHLQERLQGHDFSIVCGWNYVTAYDRWRQALSAILSGGVRHHAPSASHVCHSCGYVYDPAMGDPEGGIAPGTAFANLPDEWLCPDCGIAKADMDPLHKAA